MLTDVPSDAALALLRDLVAKVDSGIVLRAAHLSAAGELTKAGLAAANDFEHGVKLRATPDGIAYQHEIEEWADEE
ncbi:MAG: hypothetical protein K2Z80_30365 [Xanthobacteraceae bacterium]|nr:hypothetical protein [Xanthobacteraceae bacterium]